MKMNLGQGVLIAVALLLGYLLFHYAGELYLENLELKKLSTKQFQQLEQSAAEFKKRTEELEQRANQLDKALMGIDKDWGSSSLPDSVRRLLKTLSGDSATESTGDIPTTDSTAKDLHSH
nr:MAG TPA: Protein of unknown function (DUF2570) [Caudoviricetes sp.]